MDKYKYDFYKDFNIKDITFILHKRKLEELGNPIFHSFIVDLVQVFPKSYVPKSIPCQINTLGIWCKISSFDFSRFLKIPYKITFDDFENASFLNSLKMKNPDIDVLFKPLRYDY